jgi:hypothetical protein
MKGWVSDLYRLAMRLGENEVPKLVDEVERLNDNIEDLNSILASSDVEIDVSQSPVDEETDPDEAA